MDAMSLVQLGSGHEVEKGKNIKDWGRGLKSSLESITQSHQSKGLNLGMMEMSLEQTSSIILAGVSREASRSDLQVSCGVKKRGTRKTSKFLMWIV